MKSVQTRKCEIPAQTLPPCDLEWGHAGDMHANGGDGFYADQHFEEHRRRQAERKTSAERAERALEPDWWGRCKCWRPGWLEGHDDPKCEFRDGALTE